MRRTCSPVREAEIDELHQPLTKEVSSFFVDEGSGLEQVYDLIREATRQ